MDTFKKYWGFAALIIGGVMGVFGWVYNKGAETQDLNGRVFDSPEQKVYTVKKVEELPSPKQEQRKYFQDSINTAHAIASRAKRDSIMLEELKARKIADSINKLNADQVFQIKQENKEIKELLQALTND